MGQPQSLIRARNPTQAVPIAGTSKLQGGTTTVIALVPSMPSVVVA
ncbi:MAG: hypothetical protein V1649_00490 [Patescibacteria group bacterium]